MKAFHYSLLFLLPLFIPFTGSSQDQIFMNTSQSLLSLNPSFAGSNGRFRNQLSYISNPDLAARKLSYNTWVNSFDMYLNALNAGLAVTVTNDKTVGGRLVNRGIGLTYAQYFAAGKGKLKVVPSLRAVYQQKQLGTRNLTYGDMVDMRLSYFYPSNANLMLLTMPSNQRQYVSIDAGLLLQYRQRFYAGVSVTHINRPYVSMIGDDGRLPALVTTHASYNMLLSDNQLLNISARYTQQRNYSFAQLSALLTYYRSLMAGLSYIRDTGRSIPMASFGFKTNAMLFSLSYGYVHPYKTMRSAHLYPGSTGYGLWEFNFSFFFGKRGAGAPTAVEAW